MAGESLGTIRGQMILDVKQALAAYTSARQAHVATVTALNVGAGALVASSAAIAGVGGIMAAGILHAVDAAAQFERKLDYFGAVSDSTQAEYDAIREKALQLGADTIYSADQIAESFVELGKAGVGARDIIDGIGEGVANLGAAADIPLDAAAKIIMAAVQTFDLGADQAVMVADKLAGAANASIIDVEDLGVSLKYVGGVAASLGIPFQDVNTALGILGESGIKGSTAGTSLRQVLLALGGGTKKAKVALQDLGIITEDGGNKFFTAEGKAKSLAEIFQVLQDATAGMTDKQKTATMQQIFAVRALPSLISLTKAGAAGFDEMGAAIDKTTAMEVAGKRLDNLSGDIEILRGNIDTLVISSGSQVQEFARGFVQGITDIIQVFLDLPGSVQGGILVFAAVASVLLIVVGAIGMFAGAVLQIISLATIMGPVWIAIGSALKAVTTAFWALNAAMLANPIILIIVAIIAIIAALIWFFTQTELGKEIWANFVQFLTESWANIVSFATDTFNNLGNFFSDLWTNIVSFFNDAIAFIVNLFLTWHPLGIIINNWEAIVDFFVTLWNNIINGVVSFVTGFITFFQELPAKIGAFFAALPAMIGYALGFLLGTIVRVFMTIWTWLITNVPLIITNVVTFFQELPGKIVAFFIQLYTDVTTWVYNMQVQVLIWVMGLVNGFISWVQQLPGQIAAFFIQMYNDVVSWLTNLVASAIALAYSIYTGIINWVQQLPGMILQFFMDVYNNATRILTDVVNAALRFGADVYNNIRNGIEGIPRLVTNIFNNVIGAFNDMVSDAFNAAQEFAAGLWEGFKDGLGIHSPSYIEHAMWAITGVIGDETERMKKQVRIVQGLGNGISEIGNNLSFGDQLDRDLISLQNSLAAAKGLRSEVAMSSTFGVESPEAARIAELNETLAAIADKDTINVEKLEVNNAKQETAAESLPKAIRKTVDIL